MTFPAPGSASYSANAGITPAGFSNVLYLTAAPTTSTIYGPAGQLLVGQIAIVNNTASYQLIGYSTSGGTLSANWIELASSSGDVLSVTGTANQVLASPTTGNVVLSLIGPYTPATYTAHGVLVGEGTSSIVATATGTSGQLLQSGGASADPSWTTNTFPATATAGALIAATATNTIGQIVDVATGQALMSGGVGTIPAYSGSPSFSGAVTAATGLTATTGGLTVSAGGAAITGTTTINNSGAAVTTLGTGGTGAVNIGNATGNTAVTGSLTATTTLSGTTVYASGDAGGVSSTVAHTNVNSTSVSTGTGTIKMTTGNNANSSGWIKIYIGTSAYWIPVFTTDAP